MTDDAVAPTPGPKKPDWTTRIGLSVIVLILLAPFGWCHYATARDEERDEAHKKWNAEFHLIERRSWVRGSEYSLAGSNENILLLNGSIYDECTQHDVDTIVNTYRTRELTNLDFIGVTCSKGRHARSVPW